MIPNFNMIIRIFLFFTLILLSSIFFYFGYQGLKDTSFVSEIDIDKKIESTLEEKNQENNIKDTFQSSVNEHFENPKINEKEIVLTVKKNDTFNDLIHPYIKNNQVKQKIIKSIMKV